MGWAGVQRGRKRRKLTSTLTALMLVVRLVAIVVAVGVATETSPALAVDLPPIGSPLFLQTSGPNAGIGIGDWYSSPAPGGGTHHLFELNVPQLWPAGKPLTVALFDPELQVPDPVSPTAIDEIRGSGPDNATFTLLSPTGTVLANVTYTPTGGTNGRWTELLTFNPSVHGTGTYHLRSTVSNNDDNSWRLAFNHDPDCAVTGTPKTCASALLANGNQVDNPDGSPGTGDELTIGIQRASYQHGGSGQSCKTFYFFVAPGTSSITLHNFDMDGNGSVTYRSPTGSSYAGSVSGNARWNNSSNATRVGDTLAVGASDRGWWSADVCISSGNQYIFEGVNGQSVFLDLVPAVPRMTLAKSDGLTSVDPGETITYILTYTNTSNTTPNPGLATGVTISDTVPANTTYQSCSIDGPATGTCSVSAGVVTYTLSNPVLPGASGTVRLTVDVNGGASGSIANSATLNYGDPLGNSYPPKLATDVDTVRTPQLTVTKSAAPSSVEPGDVITYTVDLVNTGGGTQTGVLATDDLPPGTSPVPGSTVITRNSVATDNFQSNDYTGGSGWTGPWVESVDDGIAATGDIRIGTDLDASLRLGVGGRTGGPNQTRWIDRTFNGGGATSATLSFDYRSDNLEAGDFVYVEIYDGTTYHEVAALGNGVNQATTQSFGPVDISSYVTASSAIRIITTALSHDNDRVWFDNITIAVNSTLAGGDPPTLLSGYSLGAGESLTATYDVVVDNPATIADATNTAIARSDQSAPVSDSTTTTVTSSSIGDLVWNDLDADGIIDGGEPGIPGVTVDLTWAGPDATFDTGDEVSYPPQTTDGSGAYDFTGLPSGLFRVDVDSTTVPLGATLTTTSDPLDVNVTSGEDFNTADFGYRFPALGDVVWVDVDGDGIQDAGEPGLEGVTVSLFTGSGTPVGSPQVTAADGSYGFSGLALGDYYVVFDLSTIPGGGYLFTTPNVGGDDTLDSDADPTTGRSQTVTLAVGETQTTLDAGAYLPVTIGDVVYEDLNGNGTQDPGEPGIDGVTVDLLDAAGTTTVATTTTAGGGLYTFSTAPGSYQIDVDQTTLGLTTPVQTQGTNPQTVTLTSGQTNTGIDYGYYQPATLGNQVWDDLNGNGIQDPGEPGIAGVTVTLLQGGLPVGTDVTDATGGFGFNGLVPGTYQLEFDLTTNTAGRTYGFSPREQGGNPGLDSNADRLDGKTAPFNLISGSADDSVDAGAFTNTTIGDLVWEDLDDDGIQDPGEPGVEGVTVTLYNAVGDVVAATATAADGSYGFSAPPATYQIGFDLSTNTSGATYRFSPQGVGTDNTLDSDADPTTGLTALFSTTSGAVIDRLDAGAVAAASIGDSVWDDLNGNGIENAGEPGLAGVTVRLLDATGTTELATTTTAGDGSYTFPNLDPGTYTIDVDDATLPAGAVETTGLDPLVVTVTSGEIEVTADFGYYQPATIGDLVWDDLNDDGIQDPGEPGLEGVTVNLLNAAGTVLTTTATNASGGYTFAGLVPGQYRIGFDLSTEASAFFYELTIPYAGTDDALDSDPDPLTGLTGLNTVISGMDVTTIDAGATIVNQLPTAVDDAGTTPEDTPVVVGVLGNDSDPDGGTLSVTTVNDPANGTATINPDNTITYTPDPDYHGTDSFEYTISDGQGGTDTATVTITITPVNDPPVANDDTNTTPEDVALLVAVPGVLGNDTDVDGDSLTVTGHTQPANGTVTVNADGSLTYTPNPNFNGIDTFTYDIADGQGGTDTATVTITVASTNDLPVALDDGYSTDEDTPLTIAAPGVLANDTDDDGDSLTVTGHTQPANGTVTVNANGSLTYTPNLNFSGTDTFTYTVGDGNGGSASADVTVVVVPVNDPPVAADDIDTTDEDIPITIDVLHDDSDPEGDPLTVTAVSDPANGTATINLDPANGTAPSPR